MKLVEDSDIYSWQVKKDKGWTKASLGGFYNSKQWKKLRDYKLSTNPLCEHCKDKGVYKRADLVDHIVPITDQYDVLALDLNNLQSLCSRCHYRKTSRDNSKFSVRNLKRGEKIQKGLNDFN